MANNTIDEWKATWDWASKLWGVPEEEPGKWRLTPERLTFNEFFRGIASEIATAEGWEELGSSDVWHASYYAVKSLRESGKVTTRAQLIDGVCDNTSYGYGRYDYLK